MTVYVDSMMAPYGRMIMCHMIADSEAELHAMAAAIGIQRRWYQSYHYDISKGKRALAVERGAVEVTMIELAALRRRMMVEGHCGRPEEARAWLRRYRNEQRSQRSGHRSPSG